MFDDSEQMVFGKNGEIIGAYGMSVSPTPHTFYIENRAVNVCCAIDSLGIPLVLGIKSEIRSKCSHCGNKIGIKIGEKTLKSIKMTPLSL